MDLPWQGSMPEYGTGTPRPGSRPSRFLRWVGPVVLIAVIVGFMFPDTPQHAPTTTFASGERITVSLDPANNPMIYASGGQPSTSTKEMLDQQQYSCDLSGPDPEGLSLTEVDPIQNTVLVQPSRIVWFHIQYVEVPAPDEYQVTCEGADLRFGIGPGPPEFLNSLMMRLLMLAAFVAAFTTAIVIVVRDRSARRRS